MEDKVTYELVKPQEEQFCSNCVFAKQYMEGGTLYCSKEVKKYDAVNGWHDYEKCEEVRNNNPICLLYESKTIQWLPIIFTLATCTFLTLIGWTVVVFCGGGY